MESWFPRLTGRKVGVWIITISLLELEIQKERSTKFRKQFKNNFCGNCWYLFQLRCLFYIHSLYIELLFLTKWIKSHKDNLIEHLSMTWIISFHLCHNLHYRTSYILFETSLSHMETPHLPSWRLRPIFSYMHRTRVIIIGTLSSCPWPILLSHFLLSLRYPEQLHHQNTNSLLNFEKEAWGDC